MNDKDYAKILELIKKEGNCDNFRCSECPIDTNGRKNCSNVKWGTRPETVQKNVLKMATEMKIEVDRIKIINMI